MDDYFRLSMDTRDLNYAKFFTEGDPGEAATEHYHSHNTQRLTQEEVVDLLLSLEEVQQAISEWRRGDSADG